MADLEVVYDQQKEMAAIVNIDERRGWGPSMIGPEAGVILQAFIDTTPFDVSVLGDYEACQAFNGFLDRLAARQAPDPVADSYGAMGGDDGGGMADATVHGAEHGAPTDEAPAPAPADTDPTVASDASETDSLGGQTPMSGVVQQPSPPAGVEQPCVLCDGSGTVQTDPSEPAVMCQMCKGKGRVTVVAQA